METQSVWRRGHYLFDVHNAPWHASQGTDILLANRSDPQITSNDHGLIYHNPSPTSSEKNSPAEDLEHHDAEAAAQVYQGREFDVFGSSIMFCSRVKPNTTFIEDPFLLAAAHRDANNKRSCSSYLLDNDPSKRRKTTGLS